MKRYLLFMGQSYYARGGSHDLVDRSGSQIRLINKARQRMDDLTIPYQDQPDWRHILDAMTGKMVCGSANQAHGVDDDCDLPEGYVSYD